MTMKHICILALLLWTSMAAHVAPSAAHVAPSTAHVAPSTRFTSTSLIAPFPQTEDAVKWSFSAVKLDDGTYELHLVATLGDGWHTYSQETPSGGPAPTEISFSNNPLLSMQGVVREEGKLNKHFEPLFGVNVMQYSKRVDFVQKLVLKHPVKTTVKGKVRFMVCNDHECLPPAVKEFEINL